MQLILETEPPGDVQTKMSMDVDTPMNGDITELKNDIRSNKETTIIKDDVFMTNPENNVAVRIETEMNHELSDIAEEAVELSNLLLGNNVNENTINNTDFILENNFSKNNTENGAHPNLENKMVKISSVEEMDVDTETDLHIQNTLSNNISCLLEDSENLTEERAYADNKQMIDSLHNTSPVPHKLENDIKSSNMVLDETQDFSITDNMKLENENNANIKSEANITSVAPTGAVDTKYIESNLILKDAKKSGITTDEEKEDDSQKETEPSFDIKYVENTLADTEMSCATKEDVTHNVIEINHVTCIESKKLKETENSIASNADKNKDKITQKVENASNHVICIENKLNNTEYSIASNTDEDKDGITQKVVNASNHVSRIEIDILKDTEKSSTNSTTDEFKEVITQKVVKESNYIKCIAINELKDPEKICDAGDKVREEITENTTETANDFSCTKSKRLEITENSSATNNKIKDILQTETELSNEPVLFLESNNKPLLESDQSGNSVVETTTEFKTSTSNLVENTETVTVPDIINAEILAKDKISPEHKHLSCPVYNEEIVDNISKLEVTIHNELKESIRGNVSENDKEPENIAMDIQEDVNFEVENSTFMAKDSDNSAMVEKLLVLIAEETEKIPVLVAEETVKLPLLVAEEAENIPVLFTEKTEKQTVLVTEETEKLPVLVTEETEKLPVLVTEETKKLPVLVTGETEKPPVLVTEETEKLPVLVAEELMKLPSLIADETDNSAKEILPDINAAIDITVVSKEKVVDIDLESNIDENREEKIENKEVNTVETCDEKRTSDLIANTTMDIDITEKVDIVNESVCENTNAASNKISSIDNVTNIPTYAIENDSICLDLDQEDIETPLLKNPGDHNEKAMVFESNDNIEVIDEDDIKIIEDDESLQDPSRDEIKIADVKTLPVVCKLSNTLDFLSEDEEEPNKVDPSTNTVTSPEKQCIDIDDDDDIMLIEEDSNQKESLSDSNQVPCTDKTEFHTSNNVEPDLQSADKELIPIDISELSPNIHEKGDSPAVQDKEHEPEEILEKPLLPDNFLKTAKKSLVDMTRDELEDFCLLKIVESIVDRSGLGEIKNKMKIMERSLEEYRKKATILLKQNRDLQVVLKSVQEEQKKRTNVIQPLKITRSVGMQVLMTDKLTVRRQGPIPCQTVSIKPVRSSKNKNTNSNKPPANIPVPRLVPANNSSPKTPINSPAKVVSPNGLKTPSPVSKAPEKRPQSRMQSSSITVDLTDDEPPAKIKAKNTPVPVPPVRLVPPQNLMPQQKVQFGQNHSTPRKVYIPISPQGQNIRPGQTVMLKTVNSLTSGPRPKSLPSSRNQPSPLKLEKVLRHPAPLPEAMKQYTPPTWKPLPPAPDLKLSKVEHGIVISWRIDDIPESAYETIASYQLYAYQETSTPAIASLWKKIGDVKALPLPMACTLTQFMAGYKYYFAVRAVDVRSRLGPFSVPGSILLLSKV